MLYVEENSGARKEYDSEPSYAGGSVFSVIVSEKGGAERREVFDGSEVSVGRVRGNDLVLAKGNVSKRHARLTQKDGRYVVVDHNSTNGTYVNRQRIVQATIVREGDRIYVGDFVLQIEGARDSSPEPPDSLAQSEGTTGDLEGWQEPSVDELISPVVPPAPRLPGAASRTAEVRGPMRTAPDSAGLQPSKAPRTEASLRRTDRSAVESIRKLVERVAEKVERRTLDRDISESVARRIEAALVDELGKQRSELGLSSEVSEERLLTLARAELIGLGPLELLLHNDQVVQLTANGTKSASLVLENGKAETVVPFSCSESLDRVLARLCRQSDVSHDGRETFLTGRLGGETLWNAVRTRAAPEGIVLAVRRQTTSRTSLDELVRDGTMSRGMATFFGHCLSARANILVVGSRSAGVSRVVSALAAEVVDRQLLILEQHYRLAADVASAVRLDGGTASLDSERLVEFAQALPQASPIVENLAGACLPSVLDLVGRGLDGLVAGTIATNVEQGLVRLSNALSLQVTGLSSSAASGCIAGCFDIGVEVCSPADGRDRLRRVVEFPPEAGASSIDIFKFSIERTAAGGAVEGAFQASGSEPHLISELRSRGVSIDESLFHRSSG